MSGERLAKDNVEGSP